MIGGADTMEVIKRFKDLGQRVSSFAGQGSESVWEDVQERKSIAKVIIRGGFPK